MREKGSGGEIGIIIPNIPLELETFLPCQQNQAVQAFALILLFQMRRYWWLFCYYPVLCFLFIQALAEATEDKGGSFHDNVVEEE